MATLTAEQIRRLAEARVGFRRHALVYVLVNIGLAVIWYTTARGEGYWPMWAHLGWGIGLAAHAWGAYGPTGDDAVEREERKLREKHGMK